MHTGYDRDFPCWKRSAQALSLNRCGNKREKRRSCRRTDAAVFLFGALTGWLGFSGCDYPPAFHLGDTGHTGPAAASSSLDRKHSFGKQASKQMHTRTNSARAQIHTQKSTHTKSTHTKSTHRNPTRRSTAGCQPVLRPCSLSSLSTARRMFLGLPAFPEPHLSQRGKVTVSQRGELWSGHDLVS